MSKKRFSVYGENASSILFALQTASVADYLMWLEKSLAILN